MKKYCLMTTLMLAFLSLGFISCSKDDDGGGNGASLNGGQNLQTPVYESVSALYEVQSSESDIKSIELTASGDYIVQMNGHYPSYIAPRTKMMAKTFARTTRSVNPNIIYGKYTKISDNQFLLERWGTITVNGSDADALSITVTPQGSTASYVVPVAKHTQYPSEDLTNKICRSWKISNFRYVANLDTKQIHNKEYPCTQEGFQQFYKDLKDLGKKYASYFDEEEDDEYTHKVHKAYDEDHDEDLFEEVEVPEYVVFTKAGTYMVYYNEEKLGISTWAWKDISKGMLRYSWNYETMENNHWSGTVNVAFRNDQLAITEPLEVEEDFEEFMTWYLDEKK